MSVIEEAKKLKESIQACQAKIPELEKELTETIKIQLELDEEALKDEILELKGWQKKKEEAEKNRENTHRLKEEIEKHKNAIEILREKIKQVRNDVIDELKERYLGDYKDLIKDFAKKLKVAAEAEKKIIEMQDEAEAEARRILSDGAGPVFVTILPAFQGILVSGPFEPLNMTQYEYFLRNCKEKGFNID